MAGRFGNVGAALGQGVQIGQQAKAREEAQAMQQKQQEDAQTKLLRTQGKDAIDQLFASAESTMDAATQTLGGVDKARPAVEAMMNEAIKTHNQFVAAGRTPPESIGSIRARFGGVLQAPTAQEAVDTAAATAGATTAAQEQARVAVSPKPVSDQAMRNPTTGAIEPLDQNDPNARMIRADMIARGFTEPVTLGVAATTRGGLGVPTSKEGAGLRGDVREGQAALESLSSAMRDIEETPGAVGASGAVADKVGGLMGQLPFVGGKLEESFVHAMTNASPDEVKQVRTRMQTLTAQQLSAITGEESGRFTQQEQDLARTTLAQLPADATVAQSRAALKVILGINISEQIRTTSALGAPRWDLSKDEGIESLSEWLQDFGGMSDDEIVDIIVDQVQLSKLRK